MSKEYVTYLPETPEPWSFSRFRQWVAKNGILPDKPISVTPAQMMQVVDWPKEILAYDPVLRVSSVGVYNLVVANRPHAPEPTAG